MPKMLGKRPPSRRATLGVGDFLQVAAGIPDHPVNYPPPTLAYPMDHNDVAGDCVIAGLDHALQTIAAELGVPRTNWTDNQLLHNYQTQNPNFRSWSDGGDDARDGGMVIQDFLEYLVKSGEILAFAAVDHTDDEMMRAATYIGQAIITGEDLREAQQDQAIWDYVKGSPDWGGHCTCNVGYGAAGQIAVSWGRLQPMTTSFQTHLLDEAWFILTQDMVNHPYFRDNFDLAGFSAAIKELTNGKVVVPVTPTPAPPVPNPPVPPVGPTPPVTPTEPFPYAVMDKWRDAKGHTVTERNAQAAYRKWRSS